MICRILTSTTFGKSVRWQLEDGEKAEMDRGRVSASNQAASSQPTLTQPDPSQPTKAYMTTHKRGADTVVQNAE